MTPEYPGRFNFRSGYPDYMMDARAVDDDWSSPGGLVLRVSLRLTMTLPLICTPSVKGAFASVTTEDICV